MTDTVTMTKPKLEATPAQPAAAAHRLDGLHEAQRAGNAARAALRAIRHNIRRSAYKTRRELTARFPECLPGDPARGPSEYSCTAVMKATCAFWRPNQCSE
jgi:hypothetical protein